MVYVYLLGLSASNLCVLITVAPPMIDVAHGLGDASYATIFYKVNSLSILYITFDWSVLRT